MEAFGVKQVDRSTAKWLQRHKKAFVNDLMAGDRDMEMMDYMRRCSELGDTPLIALARIQADWTWAVPLTHQGALRRV